MRGQKIGKVQMDRNLKIQIISLTCGVFATFYLFQINDSPPQPNQSETKPAPDSILDEYTICILSQ